MNTCSERISLLKASIKENGIDFYIIPATDPHLGEYIPEYWRIIAWLTGFTGSYATVVISDSFTGLWTDSRYFIQAEKQLKGSGCILMKPSPAEPKDVFEWICNNINTGGTIAFDGRTFPIGRMRKLEKLLDGRKVSFTTECDLISEIWTDRPSLPFSSASVLKTEFSGKERDAKIKEVRQLMNDRKLDYHLLTSVDDIMWLLNIRGNDVNYSPLLTSFALVDEEQVLLFVDERQIPLKLAMDFDNLNIIMLPYEETAGLLGTLPKDSAILITPATTSVSLYNSIPSGMKIREDISIPTRLKAVKNNIEIENIRKAMVKDGVALTRFFFWLENRSGSEKITEISISTILNSFRAEQENYYGPSFSTIAAWDEHGALPHYSATPESDSVIGQSGILLIDSGGQYLNGTTDITRTIALGTPTEKQIKDFTLVLKGVINLASAKFPSGTKGFQLDVLARQALWENGFNYGHGTGHGVGYYLNVHEGPQNISQGVGEDSRTVIEKGMLISDEPGIYREGEYGIRIENLLLCFEDEETEFGKFLKFDTVSLCYIDKSLIDMALLNRKEIDWINSYHSEVYEKLGSSLPEKEKIWLREKTSKL
jgi:Xaa-Pro aminopeptidase